jgi:glycosyltransferase involved in cell wall biosynthesis
VDVERFSRRDTKDRYYLTMSRLVPYKRIDLIVDAFTEMPDKELVVIGDGPEYDAIKSAAGPNVTMLGYQPNDAVTYYMERARAFVFAAEEDFGIVPVEAQACGTPVIAYGRGGVQETVVPGVTGVFFPEQTVEHVKEAVNEFERIRGELHPEDIRAQAERFSVPVFKNTFSRIVHQAYADFVDGYSGTGGCMEATEAVPHQYPNLTVRS